MALAGKGQAQGHATAAATEEEASEATKATTATTTTTAHRAQLSVAPSIKAQTETK